jgi:HEAT repeat protein
MEQTVEELIVEATHRDDWHRRRLGIIGLGYRKDAEILPVLMGALRDPVSDVRHAAIVALGRRGDREAMVELLRPKVLASPDARIRWAATSALGKLGDHRIIDRLVDLVDDEEWLVSNQALVVMREKVEEIIRAHDLKLARVLIRMLNIPDPGITGMAMEGLRNLDRDAVPMLSEAMKSVREPVRRHAARTLGLIGDRHCSPVLVKALRDPSHPVRAEAAEALGNTVPPRALPPLVAALGDFDERVRKKVVAALVRFGSSAVKPLCIELEHSKRKFTKCAAIEALGAIGDERAIPILIQQLSSSYHVVRSSAALSLPRFGAAVVEPLRVLLSFNRSDISHLGNEVSGESDIQARVRAVRALGDLEDHRAVPLLTSLLSVPDRQMAVAASEALAKIGCAAWGRRGAVTVLGQVGDRSVIPQVVELLTDDSVNVRREAIFALGSLKAGREIENFMSIAHKDAEHSVRRAALSVLRDMRPGSPELLDTALRALEDASAEVRALAARLVGEFPDERTGPPLLALLSDSSSHVRASAESAVVTLGKAVVSDLLEILGNGSLLARRRATAALGRIGDLDTIDRMEALLEKEEDPRTISLTREALLQMHAKREID